jgi:phosphatidylglycerophosphatase A
MDRTGLVLATCGGVGYAPVAPGTFGSVAGLFLFAAVRSAGSAVVEALAIAALFGLGLWSAGVAERRLGRTDPGPIVLDEVVGMLITLALLPVNVTGALAGLLVFRALDVVKPWPAASMERLPGGLGVMADDAVAGLYGHLAMRGLLAAAPPGWFG